MNVRIICSVLSFMTMGMSMNNADCEFIEIRTHSYSGYVIPAECSVFMTIDDQDSRITPSSSNVASVEALISERVEDLNTELNNQIGGCPVIHRELENYKRQYVGFKNHNHELIVFVNMIWKDSSACDDLDQDFVQVFDGCSYYWSVMVNLSKNEVYNLRINGFG